MDADNLIGKKIKTKYLNYPTNDEPWVGQILDVKEDKSSLLGDVTYFKVKRLTGGQTVEGKIHFVPKRICEITE